MVCCIGEKAHALALALDDQAVAVVLDLVKPVRPGRNFGSSRWNARLIRRFEHASKIGDGVRNANQTAPARGVPLEPPTLGQTELGDAW